MRLLLLLLLLASSCYAAGLEYGGLTTIVPGQPSSPANYFSVSSPASELYFTWTVPQPGGSEWYSFEIDFAVAIDSSKGFCFEIAPASQLTYAADCKSCSTAGNVVVNPQPGPWFARVTNCRGRHSVECCLSSALSSPSYQLQARPLPRSEWLRSCSPL